MAAGECICFTSGFKLSREIIERRWTLGLVIANDFRYLRLSAISSSPSITERPGSTVHSPGLTIFGELLSLIVMQNNAK
jgi:hypothetical protein